MSDSETTEKDNHGLSHWKRIVVTASVEAVLGYAVAALVPTIFAFIWSAVRLWSQSNQWYWTIILPSGLLIIIIVWWMLVRHQTIHAPPDTIRSRSILPSRKAQAALGASAFLLSGFFIYDITSPLPGSLSVFGSSKPIIVIGVNATSGEQFIIDSLNSRLHDLAKLVWIGSIREIPEQNRNCRKKQDWITIEIGWKVLQNDDEKYSIGTLKQCSYDEIMGEQVALVPPDEPTGDFDNRYLLLQRAEFVIRSLTWIGLSMIAGESTVALYLPTDNLNKIRQLKENLNLREHSALDDLKQFSRTMSFLMFFDAIPSNTETSVNLASSTQSSISMLEMMLSNEWIHIFFANDNASENVVRMILSKLQAAYDKLSQINTNNSEEVDTFFRKGFAEIRKIKLEILQIRPELEVFATSIDTDLVNILMGITQHIPADSARAREAINSILSEYPINSGIWLSYLGDEIYDGSPDIAKPYVKQLLDNNPSNIDALELQYDILLNEPIDTPGIDDKIIELQTRILNLDASRIDSYIDRSDAYIATGNCTAARQDIDYAKRLACTSFAGADCIKVQVREMQFLSDSERIIQGRAILNSFKQFANDFAYLDRATIRKFPWRSLSVWIVAMASWPEPLPTEVNEFLNTVRPAGEQFPQRFRDAIVASDDILRFRNGDSNATTGCDSINDATIRGMCLNETGNKQSFVTWNSTLDTTCRPTKSP